MPADWIIATRESPLALWQAGHVRDRLLEIDPRRRIELLGMTTRGDQIVDRALAKVGGKGLFIKELEAALLEGRARLAVHSLKDVPMALEPRFRIAAVMARDDPRDAFVSSRHAALEALPRGARVGTSSLRRELMLRARHPRLAIAPVRGNVGTRLAKLDRGEFDALIMAAAGLKRLGLADRIRQILPAASFLPAPGQGALGIEILTDDEGAARAVAPLEDAATRAATTAERAVSRGLGGSCDVPLAAYAEIDQGELHLRAIVGSSASGEHVAVSGRCAPADGERLAAELVAELKARGALELIAA